MTVKLLIICLLFVYIRQNILNICYKWKKELSKLIKFVFCNILLYVIIYMILSFNYTLNCLIEY